MYNIIVPNLVHGWILCVELCGLSAEVIHNLPTPLSARAAPTKHRPRDSYLTHPSAVEFNVHVSLSLCVCDGLHGVQG